MDCNLILKQALDVLVECEVKSFPIECQSIIQHYGYRIYSYHELQLQTPELYDMCVQYSEDAFRDSELHIVAYNDQMQTRRIRFSLAHELGHIVLQHTKPTQAAEKEANFFASNLLAPRMAIHYAGCKNESDVAKVFEISHEAARYAFDDYRRWHRGIVCRQNKMTSLDRAMYYHFYDPEHKCFVYSRKKCIECGREAINSVFDRCPKCKKSRDFLLLHPYDDRDPQYQIPKEWLKLLP